MIVKSECLVPVAGTAPGNGGGGSGSGSMAAVGDTNILAGGGGRDSMEGDSDDPTEETDECDECDDTLKLDVRKGCLLGEVLGGMGALLIRLLVLYFAEKE